MVIATPGRSLSDFWRHDQSSNLASELASVLQGADMLIGNLGSALKVTWAGQGASYTDLKRGMVSLDYGPLLEAKPPFPGAAVDEVIGYAAHEGGHCLWSCSGREQRLKHEVLARRDNLPPALLRDWLTGERSVLQELARIHNVLEDAYIDRRVARTWPVLGEYIRIARSRVNQRTPLDLQAIAASPCPDRNAAINLWTSVLLYHQPAPVQRSPAVDQALGALLALAQEVEQEDQALQRFRMAAEAAAVLWRWFPVKESPPAPSKERQRNEIPGQAARDDSGSPKSSARNLDEFDPASDSEGHGRSVVPAPIPREHAGPGLERSGNLAQAVSRTLAEDPGAVTVERKPGIPNQDLAMQATADVRRQAQEIGEAFRPLDGNRRWLYGLSRGTLHDPHLWKVLAGDPGYFRRRVETEGPNLAVGLLLDVSRSMVGHLPLVHRVAAAFVEGLSRAPGVTLSVWAYAGQGAKVSLTSLWDRSLPGLCLAHLECGGGTPSGAAIAAANELMNTMRGKRRLLVHFTDGRPDNVDHVVRAVEACRARNIRVITIALAHQKSTLAACYRQGDWALIRTLQELPRGLAAMLSPMTPAG